MKLMDTERLYQKYTISDRSKELLDLNLKAHTEAIIWVKKGKVRILGHDDVIKIVA